MTAELDTRMDPNLEELEPVTIRPKKADVSVGLLSSPTPRTGATPRTAGARVDRLRHMVDEVRVKPGAKAHLGQRRPDDRLGQDDRDAAEALSTEVAERVGVLAGQLGASAAKGLLVVLQGMDASGKDGTIRHCSTASTRAPAVSSFKAPSRRSSAHDFLWRVHARLPRRGKIGDLQPLALRGRARRARPRARAGSAGAALRRINAFEQHLVDEGTVVVKFFLHICGRSRASASASASTTEKNWKFDPADLRKRAQWDDYHDAYADAIERTSTEWAPWYVMPADRRGCATWSSRRCWSTRCPGWAWRGRRSTPPSASCESPEGPAARRPLDEGGTG